MADWNPTQYARFEAERRAPFDDLVGLIRPSSPMRIVDLGCGAGPLTRELHDRFTATSTLGLDASEAMLARSAAHATTGLSFARGRIEDAPREHPGPFDLVFSNAALHWLPDLEAAVKDLAPLVAAGGQLAVQVPQNFDHASHVTAEHVAVEPRFAALLAGYVRPRAMVAPERISGLLFELGFVEQRVRLEVYAHPMRERRDVVEWVKGSLLVDYEKRLPVDVFAAFVARYEELLVPRLGAREPYLFPFKRLLFWARRPRESA